MIAGSAGYIERPALSIVDVPDHLAGFSTPLLIRGGPARIYELAANIRDWPKLLPHYRYVHVEEESAAHRIAWMGASRPASPTPPSR